MRHERNGLWVAVALMGWLTLMLWLDRVGGGGDLWGQRALGAATWLVLLAFLVWHARQACAKQESLAVQPVG